MLASADRLVLNNTNEPPFTNTEATGFLDIILREAFKRAGVEDLELVSLPAERGLLSADSGLIDGDVTRIKGLDKQYPNLVRVDEKLVDWEFVAYTARDDIRSSWEDVRRYYVGFITGWKIYEKALEGAENTLPVSDPRALFRLLRLKRADLVLYARWMGEVHLAQEGITNVHPLLPPLAVREMFIYLHKRHQALAIRLADALRAIKEEGMYDSVRARSLAPYQTKLNESHE